MTAKSALRRAYDKLAGLARSTAAVLGARFSRFAP